MIEFCLPQLPSCTQIGTQGNSRTLSRSPGYHNHQPNDKPRRTGLDSRQRCALPCFVRQNPVSAASGIDPDKTPHLQRTLTSSWFRPALAIHSGAATPSRGPTPAAHRILCFRTRESTAVDVASGERGGDSDMRRWNVRSSREMETISKCRARSQLCLCHHLGRERERALI